MIIRCLYDELVSIKELKKKFHPKNRNKHPKDQIARLAKILEYQGARYPAKISNQSGFITSGHGRVLSAEKAGWEVYPVNYQDYENEDMEYADLQADNAIAAWSDLDISAINTDLGALDPSFDIDFLGIKGLEIDVADKDSSPPALTPEAELLIKEAWVQWASEILKTIEILGKEKIFCQSFTPGALKIYFLESLYKGKHFPRSATTARQFHRMFCSGDGDNGSIVDMLMKMQSDIKYAYNLKFALQDKPSVEKLMSVSAVPMAGHKAPPDFPVELATKIMNEFATGGNILDPCHGWGGRFIGFLLSSANLYHGVDASDITSQGLKDIRNDLIGYVENKEAKFFCKPFEDFKPKSNFYDLAFTSPPYFDREIYQGGEQVNIRYKTYEEFVEGFYFKMFDNVFRGLKPGGHFVLQVGIQKYDLDEQAMKAAQKVGLKFKEKRFTEMKGMLDGEEDEAKEIILVFFKSGVTAGEEL